VRNIPATVRTATAAEWTAANPVLGLGEIGAEANTGQIKVGNGSTAWTSLPYAGAGGSGSITNVSGALSAPVDITSNNTWVDGPSVSLAAGTWLVHSHMTMARNTTTAVIWRSRITDKTNHYASGGNSSPSITNQTASVSLSVVITLASTTTIFAQGACHTGASGSANRIVSEIPTMGSGNNATIITAIKLA